MNQFPQPLSETVVEELDTNKFVVIIANDNKTKFACSKNSLVRFSKLYRALSQASEVDELPLRCPAATPETTALVCMWMNHYDLVMQEENNQSNQLDASTSSLNGNPNRNATSKTPSRVSYPLQPGNSLSCFLNEWDCWFVEKVLFAPSLNLLESTSASASADSSSNNNNNSNTAKITNSLSHQQQQQNHKNSIMGSCGRVYFLAIAATFLQAQILVELCSGIFAFHIREAELESRPVQATSGESVVRSWFNLPGEFSAQERQLVLEQNKDLRDPQGVLEKIKEMSDEAHDFAAALNGGDS